jgi:hypothetical protein
VNLHHIFSTNLLFHQGELAHRALKAFYPLTNKRNTPAQLATHEHRRRVLRRTAESGQDAYTNKDAAIDLPMGSKCHHHIPVLSRNNPLDIFKFLRQHDDDPAVAVSDSLLKVHRAHGNS